ncbi:MAG: hypothetical protein WC030_00115 [Candidatus Paceibacterota bacterium]
MDVRDAHGRDTIHSWREDAALHVGLDRGVALTVPDTPIDRALPRLGVADAYPGPDGPNAAVIEMPFDGRNGFNLQKGLLLFR